MTKNKVQVIVFARKKHAVLHLCLQTNKRRGSFWQNITGGVEKNETPLEAAKRELFEETSIPGEHNVFEMDYRFEYKDKKGQSYLEHCFWVFLDCPYPVEISSKEHQAFSWEVLSDESIEKLKFESNQIALKKAFEQWREKDLK